MDRGSWQWSWEEVHDKRQWSKPSPRKRNAKSKMVVLGGLTNSWDKKGKKGKGGKERYTHLNAQSQRISRRDEKGFLSYQCKEIEENNRMGRTRDLFKKTRDTKGTFHAKMGSIKARNRMDLTEAEDIKKRWQEYIEDALFTWMITHLSRDWSCTDHVTDHALMTWL